MFHPQKEADIQKAIFRYLVGENFLVIRINSGAVTQEYKGRERHFSFVRWQERGRRQTSRGLSDILALSPWGQLFAIECKSAGKIGQASDGQAEFLEAAERRGAVGIIADSLEDVMAAIRLHKPQPAQFF
jgi:hypothetical protein